MKKIFSILSLLTVFTLLLSSCSKNPDKILDQKEGTWNLSVLINYTIDGKIVDTELDSGIVKFTDGGYILTWANMGGEHTGIWSANKENVTFVLYGQTLIFDVLESKRKKQIWVTSISDNSTGVLYKNELIFTLTK